MYQRNDKGQIIGACVLGVFLFLVICICPMPIR